MISLSKKDRQNLIKILQEEKEVPQKYIDGLSGKNEIQKEYELTYAGKEREEDIIANTLAAPFQEVRTFNSENKYSHGWSNMLVFGDNLMALKNLYEDPNIKGKVKLIYIDPPFAVNKEFSGNKEQKAYQDKIVGAKFIEFTRKRLVFLRELLDEDGAIYVHLDEKKSHYIKVVLDEIFNDSNFRREIIWDISVLSGFKTQASNWIRGHDVIYFYTKSNNFIFNKLTLPHRQEYLDRFDKIDKQGRKYFDGRGEKIYLDDVIKKGKRIGDVWGDIMSFQQIPTSKEKIDYPTQKPEALLERIIKTSSNEGDIILDAFAGSGTALAVAEKLKRRWIGIDCGKLAIYTMQKRMLNLREEIGNKGKLLKTKAFTLYNAGLYDWSEIKRLDFGHYRNFILKLFQVREEKHKIRGLEIDGYVGGENAYLWNHTKQKKAKLDINFVKTLHEALAGKGGGKFYIIAPSNCFTFHEDEIKLGETVYKTLRVPQSIIAELVRRGGETIKQPTSEQDVNDTIDSVGFDFIQTPVVDVEYNLQKPKDKNLLNQKKQECVVSVKTFKSKTLAKSPDEFDNHETLSMIMVDFDYNGRVFDLDEVFYAESIKPDYEVRFDRDKIKAQMMLIFLDIYGNEKKVVLKLTDFKK